MYSENFVSIPSYLFAQCDIIHLQRKRMVFDGYNWKIASILDFLI
jgi:hypothetical protein